MAKNQPSTQVDGRTIGESEKTVTQTLVAHLVTTALAVIAIVKTRKQMPTS